MGLLAGALLGAVPIASVAPAGAAPKKFASCAVLLKTYKSGVAATKKAKGTSKAVVNATVYKANKALDANGNGVLCDAGDLSSGSGSSAASKKFTPKTYEGTDSDVITLSIPSGFVAAAVITYDGEDGVTVTSFDSDENMIDTVASSYGPYEGTALLTRGEDPDEPMNPATLEVEGEGKWKIKVIAASSLPQFKSKASGDGDAVYRYTGDDTDLDVVHEGDESFSVSVYDKDGVLVERTLDEYGEIDDSYSMTAGAFIVVRATASWSLALA